MTLAFETEKRALLPLIETDASETAVSSFLSLTAAQQNSFLSLLMQQGVGCHWYVLLSNNSGAQLNAATAIAALKAYTDRQQFIYLQQLKLLRTFTSHLDADGVTYAIVKGAHIREILYTPPALRPADDIDVLIRKADRFHVAELLLSHGLTWLPDKKTISNSLTFSHGDTCIDVHWDILRPGRSKIVMTEHLLSTRVRHNGYFGLSPEATLFIMLVHPVFKKYLTASHAYLSRMVDLYHWPEHHAIDWQTVFQLCEKAHLRTAAWLTATYYELLTGMCLNSEFVPRLSPSGFKKAYLHSWVNNNLSGKLFDYPLLPKVLFTLAAHDSLIDAAGFLLKNSFTGQSADSDFKRIQSLSGQ